MQERENLQATAADELRGPGTKPTNPSSYLKQRENVEFKTLDGLYLRGWLFPAAQRGPAIIIAPGLNMTKETVAWVAEYFNGVGFTVLIYDHRCIGESDGLPRNEVHPARNMEDLSDALSFLQDHVLVDPKRIALWGCSFSATIELCAAALDRRVGAVVAVCPQTIWDFTNRTKVLAMAMQDRRSRISGNEPIYLPLLDEEGNNPAGFCSGMAEEGFIEVFAYLAAKFPGYALEVSLSSYYNIAAFQPLAMMELVSPTPVMVVVPENDLVSPTELQKTLICDKLSEPKEIYIAEGKGHLAVLSSANSGKVLEPQVDFLRRTFGI